MVTQKKIVPFLSRLFLPDVEPQITEGWVYGPEEAAVYGGYTAHQAIDFAVPLGTPVLAAASGRAFASFEEVRICYPTNEPRFWLGEPVYWGYGLFIAIVHDNGLLTFYAHLNRLVEELWKKAYAAPEVLVDGDVISPMGELITKENNYHPGIKVKRGDIIGYSGVTGMGIGQRTYGNWLSGKPYRSNDEEHVHFSVSTNPVFGPDMEYVDPFGVYGHATKYPPYRADWSTLPDTLWLA